MLMNIILLMVNRKAKARAQSLMLENGRRLGLFNGDEMPMMLSHVEPHWIGPEMTEVAKTYAINK